MDGDVDTTLGVADDGRPLLVKRAETTDGCNYLRREAEILRAHAHPGIVELYDIVDDGSSVVVRQRWAGSRTLANVGAVAAEDAAGMVAALASILGDLHDGGLAHRRIERSHVIIGPAGRPVLCGLGGAELAGRPGPPGRAADDVAALGALLRDLVGADVEAEPIPERSWHLRRRSWAGYHRRALLNLADQATADDPGRRPTAHQFADAVAAAVPGARLLTASTDDAPLLPQSVDEAEPPADSAAQRTALPAWDRLWSVSEEAEPEPAPGEPPAQLTPEPPTPPIPNHLRAAQPPHGPVRRTTVGLVALATAALAGLVWLGTHRGARASVDRVSLPEPPTPAPASTTDAPSTGGCPAAEGPVADIDGDGCGEPVRVEGRTVTVGAARFEVGLDGDQVVVGDWRCDGQSTPALLRPSTGEVFRFRSYAIEEDAVTIASTNIVPGADGLRVERRDGCDALLATRPGLPAVEIAAG